MALEPDIRPEAIQAMIYIIRGQRVMLDSDLAKLYGVSTKRLKEQYRRNSSRFPEDFAFVLTRQEVANLRSQNATSRSHGGERYLPAAFTEHGIIMLASVLNSEVAVNASVRIVRTFVYLREMVAATSTLTHRLDEVERRIEGHDEDLQIVFAAIRQLIEPANEVRREIGFHTIREKASPYRARPAKKRI